MDHWTHPLLWGVLGAVSEAVDNLGTRVLATSSDDTGLYSMWTGVLATSMLFGAFGQQVPPLRTSSC